jgi:eukaryotic-like serine/threonine-protein kinase
VATLAAVVSEPPRRPVRAGPLAPLIMALLAKDPGSRPTGPKVRAWLSWLLVVALSPSRSEAHPSRRPSRAGSASTLEPSGTPAPAPGTAGAVPSRPSEEAPAFEPDQAPASPRPAGQAHPQRPARPVLPPAPPVPRRVGRRLLGMVALLLVGGVLTAWLLGGFQPDRTRDRAAPATTAGRAGVAPGEERAAPAPTRGGADVTGTTQPAPSTTQEPARTQAPTTPTTAAPRSGLPAGWRPFLNRAGSNRVGVPPGFRARTRQRYNASVVEEQGGARRLFTVRSQNPSARLPQASRDYRAWAKRNFAGFREVRYAENQTYAGRKGAVVFEYEAVRDGRRVHVSHINLKGRTWGYNVELIVPASQWDATQELARQFEQAFQPLG